MKLMEHAITEGNQPFVIERLGEQGILVRFGNHIESSAHRLVLELDARLQLEPFTGFVESVPSYAAIAIYYDPWQVFRRAGGDMLPYSVVSDYLRTLLNGGEPVLLQSTRSVTIPVCYGGEFGPDLDAVAKYHGITQDEVIRLHTQAEYEVYMIGFMPGFPYLGGLTPQLATPRHSTPRLTVPAGSVGIAGAQTGVYPMESPGGWQLIGRTPVQLFRPVETSPSLLQAGDKVRFEAISVEEYEGRQRARAGG